VVTFNGLKNLNGLVWTANGKGWYAAEITPVGHVMFYVDAGGAHSWELVRSSTVLYAVPSPDHIGSPTAAKAHKANLRARQGEYTENRGITP
jgi:hypothetical protein